MNLTITNDKLIVKRESSKKVYKESTLMTHIKRELQAQGYDIITKDLSKEPGNLLSTPCYGLIARNRDYQIYDPNYCIKPTYQDYNNGKLVLFILGEMKTKDKPSQKIDAE